jgi:hypothetical protein
MALKQQLPSKTQSTAWPVLSDCTIAHFERSKPKARGSKAPAGSENVVQTGDEYAPYPFLAYNLRPPALTPLDQVLLARLGEVALLQWDQLPEDVRSALVKAVRCAPTDMQPQKVKEKLAALQHDAPASSQ